VVGVGQISSNDDHSPVLLCLLDVLKVGLALIGNGDSGGHGRLLRAVFGLLSWVAPH